MQQLLYYHSDGETRLVQPSFGLSEAEAWTELRIVSPRYTSPPGVSDKGVINV